MKIKSITVFLTCWLSLSSLPTAAIAWECNPTCSPSACEACEAGVCVYQCSSANCETCFEGSCIECFYGGECTSCQGGSCVDDESKCPGECDTCDDGTCTDHDYECNWRLCETCNDGECEDRCPALGKYCDYDTGMCEVCVDDFHCELCEQCNVLHVCVHPCDDCVWPEYCGAACSCMECYPGPEDTTTCSASKSEDDCTGCSMNPISPCSRAGGIVVSTGSSLTTCTGPDCEILYDVLCYTTYEECEAGVFNPFLFCTPSGLVGVPYSCEINLEYPVGCWPCRQDWFEEGEEVYANRGVCPPEDWP